MDAGRTIPGVVTVEPAVLETIARLAALQVPGVVQIAERDVERLLSKSGGRAVSVEVQDGRVVVDVHIIAGPDMSLLKLGRAVQYELTRAITRMTGMPVDAVNVYIEDVQFPSAEGMTEPGVQQGTYN